MKKKISVRNKRGAISLFVLLSLLFFLVLVTGVATSFKNKETTVNSQIAKVKASYEKDLGNEEQIYAKKIKEKETELYKELEIDPNGGIWGTNLTAKTTIKQEVGSTFEIEAPTPPKVVLNTDGGNLENEVETISFVKWQLSGSGSLNGNTYTFGESKGTLTATYSKSTITLPNATKSGYNFNGWYDDKNNKVENTESYKPVGTVNLTAHWTEKATKNIILAFIDASGEEKHGTPYPLVLEEGQTSGTVTTPEIADYTGYTTKYWVKGETPDLPQVAMSGGTLDNVSENGTYYAVYQKQVEVNFNLDGATGTPPETLTGSIKVNVKVNSSNLSNISGTSITLPTEVPTKQGYKFAGWKSSEDNKIYNAGATYTSKTGATMTAQWTANTSKLTIDPDGGKVKVKSPSTADEEEISENKTYTQDNNTTLTYKKPTKADTIDTSTKYTVTYNTDGGSTAPGNQDATITIITGYTFKKWEKSEGFKGTLNEIDRIYTYPADNNTDTITATYTSQVKSTTVAPVTLPAAPTKENYDFAGWKSSANNQVYQAGASYTPTANTTMTAQWTIKKHKVTFMGNEGTPSEQYMYVEHNTAIGTLPTASRTNYGLNGWYTAPSGGTQITASTIVTADITYYAQWVSATARIGDTFYGTLTEAISAVPATQTKTTIVLLKDTSGKFTINAKQYIDFDLQNFTISNNGNLSIIENSGKIWISNGNISSNASTQGAINNNQGGEIIMTGGRVIVSGTGKRQAIYNNKGTVRISGDAYLSAQADVGSTNRATVHNLASSTLIITGGTIVSTSAIAVTNAGTMTIGTQDNNPDPTTLSIQGVTYGVYASANFNYYDGTINCRTKDKVINAESRASVRETGYDLAHGQATIENVSYYTVYLAHTYTVTFDGNEGTSSEASRPVEEGKKVGDLPEATRTGYIFKGWFTDPDDGDEVTKNTIITKNETFYAHWAKSIKITLNKNASDANIIIGSVYVEAGQPIGPLPEATRTGYIILGWFTDPNNGTLITEETPAPSADVTYYAHWQETNTAAIGDTEYGTLQEAVNAAGTSNTPVTITILENTTEQLTIAAGQNIIFDLGGNSLSNNGKKSVIENKGTITFTSGTLSSSDGAEASTINNYAGGTVTIDGIDIIATGERQAIYNYGGTVIIKGNSTISSNTSGIAPANQVGNNIPRGTIQNFAGGTVTIQSGTIIATETYAIVNTGTNSIVTLGTKDGSVNISSPMVVGNTYGVKNTATLNFYDGTIKGKTAAIEGTPTEEEENTHEVNDIEVIDEDTTYLTLHLEANASMLNNAAPNSFNIPARVSNALGNFVANNKSRISTIILIITIIIMIVTGIKILFFIKSRKNKK